jgi:hypothetical protein
MYTVLSVSKHCAPRISRGEGGRGSIFVRVAHAAQQRHVFRFLSSLWLSKFAHLLDVMVVVGEVSLRNQSLFCLFCFRSVGWVKCFGFCHWSVMRAERKRANAAYCCAYPQMVTAFTRWSFPNRGKGPGNPQLELRLRSSFTSDLSFFFWMIMMAGCRA